MCFRFEMVPISRYVYFGIECEILALSPAPWLRHGNFSDPSLIKFLGQQNFSVTPAEDRSFIQVSTYKNIFSYCCSNACKRKFFQTCKIKALGFPLMAIYTIHHNLFHFPISPYFNKTFCSTHALDQRECGKHMRGQESPGFCPRPPANRRPRRSLSTNQQRGRRRRPIRGQKKRLI